MGASRPDYSAAAQASLLDQQAAHLNGMALTGLPTSMIHLQSSMQHSPLGMNSMAQFPLNGQPSPGFPCPASVYQPSTQQALTLTQAGQQCSPVGLYGGYNNQTLFSQPRIAPHSNQDLHPKAFPKPIYSYSCLIAMALKNSKTGSLPVSEIYNFMKEHFPYFKTAPDGWKNSVRHNLSLNKCFEKVENKLSGSSRKGCLWALNPAKIDKMEEEMQKWKRKDLPAIRRSMANPDELDKLITDRPESCRRKALDAAGMTRLPVMCPSGTPLPVQTQAVTTLALQCLPLHQHHQHQHHQQQHQQQHQHQHQLQQQLQLQSQSRLAPISPAPAQTPPLHAVPDLSHSHSHSPHHPQQQQNQNQQQQARPQQDLYGLQGADVNNEVDALDPSIMDFALQGNLWEEMKDDSFNLDTLGTFSNFPLRLSDCDLDTSGAPPTSSSTPTLQYPDLQLTGVYTSVNSLDALSTQYMSSQGASKPIVLL
ncbi:hypothetical protein ACEWY4_011668 [Coilia grayii]|uniref:Fork-head domain-containing protein n=1 Tax=Coilia grayii TaxID=363190 RepID=A0ABD1JYA5_9TELE